MNHDAPDARRLASSRSARMPVVLRGAYVIDRVVAWALLACTFASGLIVGMVLGLVLR